MSDQEQPIWQFKSVGLLAELSKVLMGFFYGLACLIQACYSAAEGIHRDLTAHYNYLHSQDMFAAQVAYDLECLDSTEE